MSRSGRAHPDPTLGSNGPNDPGGAGEMRPGPAGGASSGYFCSVLLPFPFFDRFRIINPMTAATVSAMTMMLSNVRDTTPPF